MGGVSIRLRRNCCISFSAIASSAVKRRRRALLQTSLHRPPTLNGFVAVVTSSVSTIRGVVSLRYFVIPVVQGCHLLTRGERCSSYLQVHWIMSRASSQMQTFSGGKGPHGVNMACLRPGKTRLNIHDKHFRYAFPGYPLGRMGGRYRVPTRYSVREPLHRNSWCWRGNLRGV